MIRQNTYQSGSYVVVTLIGAAFPVELACFSFVQALLASVQSAWCGSGECSKSQDGQDGRFKELHRKVRIEERRSSLLEGM